MIRPPQGGIGAVNARVYAVKVRRLCHPDKGSKFLMLCKANCNRLLDVARETYKENVADILQLARTLSETHELPLVALYQDSGFVFTLKKNDLDGELPSGFINVSMKKGKWVFSSMELVGLAALVASTILYQFLGFVEEDERKDERCLG